MLNLMKSPVAKQVGNKILKNDSSNKIVKNNSTI